MPGWTSYFEHVEFFEPRPFPPSDNTTPGRLDERGQRMKGLTQAKCTRTW